MIKINLLKEKDDQKSSRSFPKSFAIIPLAFIAIAVTIYLVTVMGNRPKEQPVARVEHMTAPQPEHADTTAAAEAPVQRSPNAELPAVAPAVAPVKPIPVDTVARPAKEPVRKEPENKTAAAGVPADTVKSKFSPSTHASEKVVEEVVRDRTKRNASDLLALTYKEMSQGEKINYEIAFTKKIFELLTRSVPEGIEFSSLTIDSFSVIKAIGLGSSRDLVGNLFRSLRNEKNLQLHERPVSSIRPLGAKGYRFDFTCDAFFGVDTSEAYAVTSHLKPHENFNGILRTFSNLAASDGITLKRGLERIGTENVSGCRRYTYHLSGSSTYLGFVKLVLDMQKTRLPCSFNSIRIKARNNSEVAIEADIVFTLLS